MRSPWVQPGWLTRRQWLRQTAALAAAPALSRCGGASAGGGEESAAAGVADGTVIVLGAGLAGLRAASLLRAGGVDVLVLEARDRIGGRTVTAQVGEVPFDLGAAWIHTQEGNPLTQAAAEAGLALVDYTEDFSAFVSGSGWLSDRQALRLDDLEVEFEAAVPALREELGAEATVAQGVDRFVLDAEIGVLAPELVADVLKNDFELEYGGAAETGSLAGFTEDEEFDGADALIVGGYSGLVQAQAAGLDIRLQSVARHVAVTPAGVEVTLESGAVVLGSAVIVTLPLGVLQSGSVTFDPPLPEAKAQAIQRMRMGNLEKVLLRFDRAFLPGDLQDFFYLTQPRDFAPDFTNLSRQLGETTLVMFTGGAEGQRRAQQSDEDAVARAVGALADVFGTIPDPVGTAVTRWSTDPFALGSYSYVPLGSSLEDNWQLRTTAHGRLFFAGEAASDRYPGTAHGAWLTGEAAAKSILSR